MLNNLMAKKLLFVVAISVIIFIASNSNLFAQCYFDARTDKNYVKPESELTVVVPETGISYLGEACVYVKSIRHESQEQELPWQQDLPHGFFSGEMKDIDLRQGWFLLSKASAASLEFPGKVKIVVAEARDWRWTRVMPPKVELQQNTLRLLIGLYSEPGPHIQNYMPSAWYTTVIVENLPEGEYNIYLDKTLSGSIKISNGSRKTVPGSR